MEVCHCNILQRNRCLNHNWYFFCLLLYSSSSLCISLTQLGLKVFKSFFLFTIAEGACGYGDLHKTSYGKYSAGLSTMLFNRGSTCGGCFELRCVDHILWCLQGSPSVILTATDFCPPNFGLPTDYGGWCNFPQEHFEMSEAAFAEIAGLHADIVPVQYRR